MGSGDYYHLIRVNYCGGCHVMPTCSENKVVQKWAWSILSLVSLGLQVLSFCKLIPIGLTEVFGFITGAVCVLLVIQQNIWNFPIGIANNIFFIVLFLSSRLYGDMALQGVYVALGVLGWWQWLHSGEHRTKLSISHASVREIAIIVAVGLVATVGLTLYFQSISDSAPFLDALTTVLSLIAQYLLNCKRIENWYVWITADILYVGLYVQKGLHLTAVLYAIFITMCIAGLRSWAKSLQQQNGKSVIP